MSPGTEQGAQNTVVSKTEGVPLGSTIQRGRGGVDQHLGEALGTEEEGG